MASKCFPRGIVLLTDFSKNIPGGRDLRGINLRPHRRVVGNLSQEHFSLPAIENSSMDGSVRVCCGPHGTFQLAFLLPNSSQSADSS